MITSLVEFGTTSELQLAAVVHDPPLGPTQLTALKRNRCSNGSMRELVNRRLFPCRF
jgi:hypothetical protein